MIKKSEINQKERKNIYQLMRFICTLLNNNDNKEKKPASKFHVTHTQIIQHTSVIHY